MTWRKSGVQVPHGPPAEPAPVAVFRSVNTHPLRGAPDRTPNRCPSSKLLRLLWVSPVLQDRSRYLIAGDDPTGPRGLAEAVGWLTRNARVDPNEGALLADLDNDWFDAMFDYAREDSHIRRSGSGSCLNSGVEECSRDQPGRLCRKSDGSTLSCPCR